MTDKPKKSGGELFIVDNSDDNWKVQRYLHDWCDIARAIEAHGVGRLSRLNSSLALLRIAKERTRG